MEGKIYTIRSILDQIALYILRILSKAINRWSTETFYNFNGYQFMEKLFPII